MSELFGLGRTQSELDFVNVNVDGDLRLYVDPFALSQRTDPWCRGAHETLILFFQKAVDFIRCGQIGKARELLGNLHEPNETRLGDSRNEPNGAGIGPDQAEALLTALSGSTAVKTGFLQHLEDCELMVEGVGRDKISDVTTNVIRRHLVGYSQRQCALWGIPTREVALDPCFDDTQETWVSGYHRLPVIDGVPLLLVPKVIVRRAPAYDHRKYYRWFVLEYLRAENLSANTSLVRAFKNGKRKVLVKDLEKTYPCTKDFLFEFSRDHPDELDRYRADLQEMEKRGPAAPVSREDEVVLADALILGLASIPTGPDRATEYHRIMVGILEFLFYPSLLNPSTEREIHEGRKRIDIVMENGASDGIFHRLNTVRHYPCPYVAIECKNYTKDVANPEFDQIAGRFSPLRGKVGFLCFRSVDDRTKLVASCRDHFTDDHGLIIPLDDATVMTLLRQIRDSGRVELDRAVGRLVDEVWLN